MHHKHYVIKVVVMTSGIMSQFRAQTSKGSLSKMMSQPLWSKKLNETCSWGCLWKILFPTVLTPRYGNRNILIPRLTRVLPEFSFWFHRARQGTSGSRERKRQTIWHFPNLLSIYSFIYPSHPSIHPFIHPSIPPWSSSHYVLYCTRYILSTLEIWYYQMAWDHFSFPMRLLATSSWQGRLDRMLETFLSNPSSVWGTHGCTGTNEKCCSTKGLDTRDLPCPSPSTLSCLTCR